jgi:hypothetical protein
MPSSFLWGYFFFESRKAICCKVFAVHSGAGRKFVSHLEFEGISHHRRHEFCRLNIAPWFYDDLISGKGPHSVQRIGEKEPRLVPGDKMMPSIFCGRFQDQYHLTRVSAPLLFSILVSRGVASKVNKSTKTQDRRAGCSAQ